MKKKFINLSFYFLFFIAGFCCCFYLQPNKTESTSFVIDEITTTSFVTKTIKEVYKEETNQKTEEKEKIIIRKIAVPCNCSDQSNHSQQNGLNGLNNDENNSFIATPNSELKLSENGYMLIYEEIRENEKKDETSHSTYTEKEKSDSSLAQTTSSKLEDKKETKIERETSFLIGIGVESSIFKLDPRYSINAHKKIIGPLWLGAEVESNKKLDVSVKLNASIGF